MAALNCQPVIETADASVTVDVVSRAVQRYSISDGSNVVTTAWSDNLAKHAYKNSGDQKNVTVR